MSRINQVSPDSVKSKLGMAPNMTRAMANSAPVLEAYVHFSGALSKGKLPAKIREQIALAINEANGCGYCLAAHSTIGKMVGLNADQIRDSRLGTSVDPHFDTLIRFARKVSETRGRVTDRDLAAVREAGFDDGAIAEVVANVALNAFTNYFNSVANTDIDFPKAEPLS
jgi:uncharacterized peroxidase-related enzyme